MTGFLSQLAGIATGDHAPGAAVVDLPPRFGWSASPPARVLPRGAGSTNAGSGRRPAAASVAPARDGDGGAESHPRAPADETGTQEHDASASGAVRAIPEFAPEGSAMPLSGAATASPSRPLAVGTAVPRPAGPAARHLLANGRAAPDSEGGHEVELAAAIPDASSGAIPNPRPLAAPTAVPINAPTAPGMASRGGRQHAPLSNAALAGRSPAEREATVIHVTIDRLDVRAPAAARPAPQAPRPRPGPSQSLSDFLRGGATGRGEP